jgi:hypothetical protein
MLPERFQFGLAQVGPIDALSPQGVQADKHQAMVNTVKSGWTNPDNGVYYSWTLMKPKKLAAGEVIGDDPAFLPAPAPETSSMYESATL